MTAFARESSATGAGTITCELRSVNHRYLELNPRLSDELRRLEPRIREAVSGRIKRGRIDCYLRLQSHEAPGGELIVDQDLLARVARLGSETLEQFPQLAPLSVSDVLRWPGVVEAAGVDAEALEKTAMSLVDRALESVCRDRAREGERLQAIIESRLTEARQLVARLTERLPEITSSFRERISARVEDSGAGVDPERMEQELVLYVQKADLTEEVDRLGIHLEEVHDVLSNPGPAGRRLDFLMQELNREANTLGAKAFDTELTQASVDLKVLIEQMREQVQNIE